MKVMDISVQATDGADAVARPASLPGAVGHFLSRRFDRIVDSVVRQSDLAQSRLRPVFRPVLRRLLRRGTAAARLRHAMQQMPLLRAERTYNTAHPDYDRYLVRNFPGRIFNHNIPCDNAAFRALATVGRRRHVSRRAWKPVLGAALAEALSVPHADQVFEGRAFVEQYVSELEGKYGGHYVPGWVMLDDALFLYWLVRQTKPQTILQTGVCNGLSAALMMLALVKNGPEGRLRAIDLPPVFNLADPAWTVRGTVYGVIIPEGKTSGWLIPDAYRDRFEVWNGDAKDLLPKLVDSVDSIDFFFHDSDHTYDHMMFEFHEVKPKLARGGLLVSDDVSWNTSLWDFADLFQAPAYNFRGAIGVAFF